jgi:hypothetical protein
MPKSMVVMGLYGLFLGRACNLVSHGAGGCWLWVVTVTGPGRLRFFFYFDTFIKFGLLKKWPF